jgi:rhodanese-related sulfurtransferase
MKKWIIGIIAVVALSTSFLILSKPDNSKTTGVESANTSTALPTNFNQIQSAITNGAALLDVRTAEEYVAGHIEGATNLSLQDVQAGKRPNGNKNQVLYVYCRSGNRSGQATTILQKDGYSNVIDLGAITKVESIGGKIVTGS